MAQEESSRQPYTYGGYDYGGGPTKSQWEESSLRYYFDILRRRVWTVAAVLVVFVTIGTIRAYRMPKVYKATAKVVAEKHTPRVIQFEGMAQDQAWWDPSYYATQVELARSEAVLSNALKNPLIRDYFGEGKVADKPVMQKKSLFREIKDTIVGLLGAVPAPPAEPWERLRGQIRVVNKRDTQFILFESTGGDPKRAAAIANAVARAFEAYHLDRKTAIMEEATSFLSVEKKKQEKLLLAAEAELQKFRAQAKEVALSPSEKDQPAIRRLAELSETLTRIQLQRIAITAELKAIREATRAEGRLVDDKYERLFSFPTIRNDEAAQSIHDRLDEARIEQARLGKIYGPEHPLFKDSRANVSALEKQFKTELRRIVTSLADEARIFTSQEEALIEEQGLQKADALELAKEVFSFVRLDSAVKRHQKLYDTLVERLGELDVSQSLVRTNARVVERAPKPRVPLPQNKGRRILLALIFGMAAGVGLAFFFENLDDTIKTPEDLKARLPVPLLGFIPKMERAEDASSGVDEPFVRHGLMSVKEPTSSIVEAYRGIRTRLFFSIPADEVKILGLTSCGPGEGKTTTASNLALVTSMAGKRVLLIDADLHRPRIHKIFNVDNSVGLTSILAGVAKDLEAVRRLEFEDCVADFLDVIPAGPESPNPSELLGSHKMKEFLMRVRDKYDWVFVDMPPVLFISDASVLSALCEGVVLVVKSAKSNRSILLRTKEQLEQLNARIIGCILNNVVFSRMGRYYSDYKYYGYANYSSDYRKTYGRDSDKEELKRSERERSQGK